MNFNVKFTTVERILDLICPCKCRGCGKIGDELCERCIFYITRQKRRAFKRDGIYFGGIRDGILAKLVIDYKYHAVRSLARPLAKIMAEGIGKGLKGGDKAVVVVPLPTISKHIRARGFDHTLYLAKELAKLKGWKMVELLERINNTVQVGADEATRKKQASEAYRVVEKEAEKVDKTEAILLVDDVTTTGASLEAAKEVLEKEGFENIKMAVVAKSEGIAEDDN